jgi:leader peptidase (prepilin peptidase)/N-methyltransferase
MGFGDVTMMAGVGAALGPERALLTVIVGAFVGAVASVTVLVPAAWLLHRRRTAARGAGVASVAVATPAVATLAGATEEAPAAESDDDGFELPLVPFGVFLAPAALLTLLFGDRMIAWYFAATLPS